MAIELHGIDLENVHRITTLESGGFVAHHVPGGQGDLIQDTGRKSLQLQIDGILYGEKKDEDLKKLRDAYIKREAVEFLAQLTGQAYAAKVVIDTLRVMETGKFTNQYTYLLVIQEYVEPPSSGPVGLDNVNKQIGIEAMEIMDVMEIPELLALGSVPELSNPVAPLKDALTPVQEASKALIDSVSGLKTILG